jgi:hypothetical protein
MSDVLDLDALMPEPKTIILGGNKIKVQPPKLKTVFALQKTFIMLQDGKPDAGEKIVEALSAIVPDIKNDNVDLTVEQLQALIQFVSEMATGGGGGKKVLQKKTPSVER